MSAQISVEELEAAMAAAVDEDGSDIRLAEVLSRLTPEQRLPSDENVRRWALNFEVGQCKRRELRRDL